MTQAIIFDFDGLMVDTETPAYHAFCQVYAEYGQELPLLTYAKCVGTSFDVFNPYTHLVELLDHKVETELIRTKVDVIFKEMLQAATPRPGVEQYLKSATAMNLKIGLASSSFYEWIEPYLIKFDLRHYFDAICTADVVSEVKPNPELYLLCAEKLGVDPADAIAFEDSINGSKAAFAAGMPCVIVPNEMTKHYTFLEYSLMIPSMTDMALADVITSISR
ncbi:HAD family hydrolase [Paenibacillus pini]